MISDNYSSSSLRLENVIEVNPPTVDSQMAVMDVMAKMNQKNTQDCHNSSYILVVEKSKLVGIFTERDIVKLTAAELDLAAITVEEVMTTKLITFKKSDFVNIYSLMTILRKTRLGIFPLLTISNK